MWFSVLHKWLCSYCNTLLHSTGLCSDEIEFLFSQKSYAYDILLIKDILYKLFVCLFVNKSNDLTFEMLYVYDESFSISKCFRNRHKRYTTSSPACNECTISFYMWKQTILLPQVHYAATNQIAKLRFLHATCVFCCNSIWVQYWPNALHSNYLDTNFAKANTIYRSFCSLQRTL